MITGDQEPWLLQRSLPGMGDLTFHGHTWGNVTWNDLNNHYQPSQEWWMNYVINIWIWLIFEWYSWSIADNIKVSFSKLFFFIIKFWKTLSEMDQTSKFLQKNDYHPRLYFSKNNHAFIPSKNLLQTDWKKGNNLQCNKFVVTWAICMKMHRDLVFCVYNLSSRGNCHTIHSFDVMDWFLNAYHIAKHKITDKLRQRSLLY